jgi:hypothetical protein
VGDNADIPYRTISRARLGGVMAQVVTDAGNGVRVVRTYRTDREKGLAEKMMDAPSQLEDPNWGQPVQVPHISSVPWRYRK